MHIRVDGTPAPQGSVNAWAIKNKGEYTGQVGMRSASKKHAPWRNAVQDAAEKALIASNQFWTKGQPAVVEIRFYMPRPKDHHGTGKNAGKLKPSAPAWPLGVARDDIDKLTRTVLDALQGAGVVADDSQFVGLTAWRVYADQLAPGADIWVSPAPAGLPSFTIQDPRAALALGLGRTPPEQLVNFGTGNPLMDDVRTGRRGRGWADVPGPDLGAGDLVNGGNESDQP